MKTAFVFPGQGAQQIGMGADFAASPLVAKAAEVCGFDVFGVMTLGPQEKLLSTTYCQPALFLHSALVLEAMRSKGLKVSPDYCLGLSLGEYSALYAAGVLSFEDTLKALVVRGSAMQEACLKSEGGMLSVLGLDDEAVVSACEEARQGDVLQAANFNSPGQIVVSGELEALARATELLNKAGARRVLPLKVAGAFHSPLMRPAAEKLRNCLQGLHFCEGCEKVISNVSARPHAPNSLIENLVLQLEAPVKWSQSITHLVRDSGIEAFVEIGTGKVLAGLIKRTEKDASTLSVGARGDFESLKGSWLLD
ncbi:MAG: ACP S-malonyltransferase [Planctomycetes bacterium]|nr:ACP S-malonyltransferase [Planctomycetota bacterium]